MAEYAKKLHIRKSSVVTDIKLYSTTGEVGSNYLTLKDGSNVIYAKADAIGSANASDLRIRKGGNVYAILTQATAVPYSKTDYTTAGTFTFTVPAGVNRARITVAAGGGGGGGFASQREYAGDVLKYAYGGPGGRGGYTYQTIDVVAGQTYTVVVGGGGLRGTSVYRFGDYGFYAVAGQAGGNSSFGTYSCTGGGGGGGGYAGYTQEDCVTGTTGTSYGTGATGGAGGTAEDGGGVYSATSGNVGWVSVEVGEGIA